MGQGKFEQTLLHSAPQVIGLSIGVVLAIVGGYCVAQGLAPAIVTLAAIVALAWVFVFLTTPLNGMIAIVILKTLTDRVDLPIVGPLTVNALFYLAVLGSGLAYYTLNRASMKSTRATLVYGLFVAYALITALFSPDKAQAIALWVREAAMLMLYILFGTLMITEKDQRKYIYLITVIAIIGVVMSLAQRAGLISHSYESRYSGTFGHPNFFAYFLLIPTGIAASFLMFSRSWRMRGLCAVFLVLSLVGLVLTYTRGAWIAAAVMCLLLGLLGRKWFLACSLAPMLVAYFVMPSIQERLHWVVDNPNLNAASAGRISMWAAGIPLIKQHPFFGNGLQSYVYYTAGDAHNSYLKLQFETGALGLLLYGIFLLINLAYIWRVWRRSTDRFEKTLALGVFCFFVALLVGGLWENLFLGQGTEWFYYSAAGMMAAATGRLAPPARAPATVPLPIRRASVVSTP